MPVPRFLQTPYQQDQLQVIQFGNLPVPVTGKILPWVNLNDRVAWYALSSPVIDNQHIVNKKSALAWRGRAVWTAQDFTGRSIRIPAVYDETCGVPFSQAKSYLTQSGEQYLSFDGLTGLRVRTNSFSQTKFLTDFPDAPGQYMHSVEIEFASRNPFMQDMVASSIAPVAVNTGTTTYNVTYAGLAIGFPTITISVPSSNAAVITQVIVTNVTSGEQLTVSFPSGSVQFIAHQAHKIYINSDQLAASLDSTLVSAVGAFPYLYPNFPPPLSQTFSVTVNTVGNAALTGSTFSMQWFSQWEI